MKKSAVFLLIVTIALWMGSACAKKPAAPVAGSAKAEDVLSLLPKEAKGVFVTDVKRIMSTDAVKKALQEGEQAKKYQQFVQETGIDPQKDVYFLVAGVMGSLGQKEQEGVAVINMKYNKDLLLAQVKKQKGEMTETAYDGLTVYQVTSSEMPKPMSGCFLDNSNIVIGNDAAVKQVIDIYHKKGEGLLKNAGLQNLIAGANKAAMVWGAFEVPAEAMKQAASQNPMLGAFDSIRAMLMSFDVKEGNLAIEIKASSPDEAKNKQMADALNGFKALGAGAASKEPQVGEVLNAVVISSAADHVKISANIPLTLLESLGQKMKVQKSEEKTEEKN